MKKSYIEVGASLAKYNLKKNLKLARRAVDIGQTYIKPVSRVDFSIILAKKQQCTLCTILYGFYYFRKLNCKQCGRGLCQNEHNFKVNVHANFTKHDKGVGTKKCPQLA